MSSYLVVLRTPHAARAFAAALIGRLSYGLVYLALMLAVIRATGSYPTAGVFLALFGLTSSVLSPLRARFVDRHGPRRVLPVMAAVYASALAAIAVATWHPGASEPTLYVLAAAAGSSTPPLGPVMRALWSDLLPDPALRQRAFSLDTVAEEVMYIGGPLLAGAVAAVANPSLGVALSAFLILTGNLLLVTSPAVNGAAGVEPGTVGAARFATAVRLHRPMLIAASVGMCLGALSLLVVAFAQSENHLAAVAWIEAALAAGSVAGGLTYGAITWRMPAARRLPLLAAAMGASLAMAGLSANLYVLAALVGVVGLFVSPSLTTAYLIVDETAAPDARIQAGAWVSTAFNLSNSVGVAVVGLLLAHLSLPLCFAIAATPACMAALMAFTRVKTAKQAAAISGISPPRVF